MEEVLRLRVRLLVERHCAATGQTWSYIGMHAVRDKSFLSRLFNPAVSRQFTARKYDEIVRWLSANWAKGAEWPAEIPRPEAAVQPEPVTAA